VLSAYRCVSGISIKMLSTVTANYIASEGHILWL